MKMFTKLQVNILFSNTLEEMHVYSNFIKYLLTNKRKLHDDGNMTLSEKCS